MSLHDEFFHAFAHRLRDGRLCAANPTFSNPSWQSAGLRLLILRLSSFTDIERSTPHLFLAGETRAEMPDAFIDMAFRPVPADAALLAQHGVPLIVGTQSHRSLDEFDLVLLSNSYLLELLDLPALLAGSGVPLWSSRRNEQWPPLVLGGSNASAAHAIVKPDGDCIADAIFFGEGEGRVARIVRLWRALPAMPRAARISRIADEVPGLWPAGSLERRTVRAVATVEEGARQGQPIPILPGAEAGTVRLAITMGCPSMCSFCFEGHDRKPFREIPLEALLAEARKLKLATGAEALELSSYNFNTHGRLAELLEGLNGMFLQVNSMSQRADILARTPGLLALELAADKRSYTLGVEGISARQRRFLHKGVTEVDVRRALALLHDAKVREIKLFYLLTGRETAEDFLEFTLFVRWLKELRRSADSTPRAIFSFGMLVRMPFTPLRHDGAVLDQQAWQPLIDRARSACDAGGLEFRLAARWEEYALTQGLAGGGEAAHELLEGRPTTEWIEAHKTDLESEKPVAHPFSFGFLEDEQGRASLHRQFVRARAGRDDAGAREQAGSDRPPVPAARIARVSELMQRKHRLKPVFVTVRVPRDAAGFGPEWRDAGLMRTLLRAHPDQIENVLAIRECLLGSWIGSSEAPWFGWTVIAVTAWDTASALRALRVLGGEPVQGPPAGEALSFRSLELRLELPAPYFRGAGARLAQFLNGQHVPVTLQRSGEGSMYVAGDKARRRKALMEGTFSDTPEATVLLLRVGPKFPVADYLDSFAEPGASRRALLEVKAIEL